MREPEIKPLRWIGSARADLRSFPAPVRQVMGTALYLAQTGGKHPAAKPLKHLVKGTAILEIVEDHDTDTFRAVYTVKFKGVVYVLHAFQKKAKHASRTPRHHLELVRDRYQQAKADYEREFGGGKGRAS